MKTSKGNVTILNNQAMTEDVKEIYDLAVLFFMSGMTQDQFCESTGINIQFFRNRKYNYEDVFDRAQQEVIAIRSKMNKGEVQKQPNDQPGDQPSEVEDKIIVEWPNGTKMEFETVEEFNETLGIFPVFFMRYCGYRQMNVMRDHQVVAAFQHAPGDHSILPLVHLKSTAWWKMPLEARFRIFDDNGCRLVGGRLIEHLIDSGRARELNEAVEHLRLWNMTQECRLQSPSPMTKVLPGEKWPKRVFMYRPNRDDDDPRRQSS